MAESPGCALASGAFVQIEDAQPTRHLLGQHSDAGRKPLNRDFHGACIPTDAHRSGIAIALADGISSSEVSHIASETAVASSRTTSAPPMPGR